MHPTADISRTSVCVVTDARDRDGRAIRDAVAHTIAARYVDPERAASIADVVRSWPAPTSEPPWEQWTVLLRAFDRHLRVRPGPRVRVPDVGARLAPADDAPFLALDGSGPVGVLRVRTFPDPDAPGRRAEVLDALEALTASRAVVLDLRGCPGGWPTMVELLAAPFFGQRPVHVVDFVSRSGVEASWTRPVPGLGTLAKVPLAVLVDRGTASAGESMATLLESTGRAVVVGERTAGAANPGEWFDTGAGAEVFVSTGTPVDPRTGRSWEATGVVPELPARATEAQEVAVAHLIGELDRRGFRGRP